MTPAALKKLYPRFWKDTEISFNSELTKFNIAYTLFTPEKKDVLAFNLTVLATVEHHREILRMGITKKVLTKKEK